MHRARQSIGLACAVLSCLLCACTQSKSAGDTPVVGVCTASGFTAPPSSPPSPGLDGQAIDVAVAHNSLIYDPCRNVYYASVPGSAPSGNSIATIDPTGQVSYSAPVGSEPNALAMAPDGSVLYVGLDGTGDVARLALPSMTEQGRARLPSDASFGQMRAESIAVSPTDPNVVAVAMMLGTTVKHSGVALLRNMVMQPKVTAEFGEGSDVVAFDPSGAAIYGLNNGDSEFGLRRIQVLADGVAEAQVLPRAGDDFGMTALAVVDGRIVAGRRMFSAPGLLPLGVVSGATECMRPRSVRLLVCFKLNSGTSETRLLVASADTFVIRASLLAAATEPSFPVRRLVEGPNGQVAISYTRIFPASTSQLTLFSSDRLLAPPAPPPVSWPVTPFSTPDGQGLDVGLAHNSLVYDRTRNVYYASVPGSVIGAGNTVATIDPATGQVTHSAPVGSEPGTLAVAPDGGALYVGLDGSSEVIRLALPSMAALARTRLDLDPNFGRTNAQSIAVSPADPAVVAVSVAISGLNPGNTKVVLLRDMVAQPKRIAFPSSENDLLVFDPAGGVLYGADVSSPFLGLHASSVLPDGVVEQSSINQGSSSFARSLSFSNNRLIVGSAVHDATTLAALGHVTTQSDCIPPRSAAHLVCLAPAASVAGPVRLLLADPATFVIRGSLQFGLDQIVGPRIFIEGPDGQVAAAYPGVSDPKIRLFSSPQLLTLPTPPPVSWPVASSSTADGQVLDIGIVHNALVYDAVHNLYYASVPGSVIGAGNTIASIDPATGAVAHSAPIGSDPNPIAIAADASAIYVGLDGSGEVLKLALPSMAEAGRVRMPVDSLFGQSRALAIAVSPADPEVVAVSSDDFSFGTALLRSMAVQPRFGPGSAPPSLLAFDTAGTTLYGGLPGNSVVVSQVLADGLSSAFGTATPGFLSLSFANNRLVTGPNLYDTPALGLAGTIAGASDCWPDRTGNQVLCFAPSSPGHVLVASATTFAVGASLVYVASEPDAPRRLVQGPGGEIGISYVPPFAPPSVRLFSSAQLP